MKSTANLLAVKKAQEAVQFSIISTINTSDGMKLTSLLKQSLQTEYCYVHGVYLSCSGCVGGSFALFISGDHICNPCSDCSVWCSNYFCGFVEGQPGVICTCVLWGSHCGPNSSLVMVKWPAMIFDPLSHSLPSNALSQPEQVDGVQAEKSQPFFSNTALMGQLIMESSVQQTSLFPDLFEILCRLCFLCLHESNFVKC